MRWRSAVGADAHGGARTLAAQAARDLREILLHAVVDARRDILRQVDALHAHVDELDAEAGDGVIGLAEHVAGDGGALGGDDLLERCAARPRS